MVVVVGTVGAVVMAVVAVVVIVGVAWVVVMAVVVGPVVVVVGSVVVAVVVVWGWRWCGGAVSAHAGTASGTP